MAHEDGVNLSVVVPAFNEVDNLQPLLDQVRNALDEAAVGTWELILVDDASTDGSGELMDTLASRNEPVRALHLASRSGQSAALDAGFKNARGGLIALLDADLQTHPGDLPQMIEVMDAEGVEAVIGIRAERHDSGWKKFSSRFANGVRNWLTHEDIQDTGCPIKVFRAEAIRTICLFDGAHRFLPTLLKMKGFSVHQVPVRHFSREKGTSKYGTWDRALRGLHDALGVRWAQKRALQWRLRSSDE